MQRADVSETDKDLERTGLTRPKGAEDPPPPPPPQEETDTEEILESAQSVRAKETSAGLTAELHSEKNTLLII